MHTDGEQFWKKNAYIRVDVDGGLDESDVRI